MEEIVLLEMRWIWPGEFAEDVNQYVRFRHLFELEKPEAGQLLVSCEGNFAAFINGQFVMTGQFTDFPEKPTYSQIEIGKYLREGKNELRILGYHFGVHHFSHIPAEASLCYLLDCGEKVISSGTDTEYQLDAAYRSGELERLTPQLGFVFEYDAPKEKDSWQKIEKEDIVQRPNPEPRPLPLMELKAQTPMEIIAQGVFSREWLEDKTFAQLMQADSLSTERKAGEGSYMIIDMGREECGFITLDVEASGGTILDIAVGQHLEGGRVCAYVGGRNFVSRYNCSEGRQTFTHYINRYSGRYIQIHTSTFNAEPIIHYAGLIPAEYPIEFSGKFNCDDQLVNKIYEVCGRTLHLCMHEHYEDTPWREQALYANDSRLQALAGYYVFGEYEFPKVSFDMLAQAMREDKFLPLTAPSRAIDFTIPSFTFSWIAAMRDLLLYSGDIKCLESKIQQIKEIMDAMITRCKDDLLLCPKGHEYWHFYDWADGLDGVEGGGCTSWLEITTDRFDAPLNLFFVLALQAASDICKLLEDEKSSEIYLSQAEKTKQKINTTFWVESRMAYQTYVGEQGINNHFCELVQALAVIVGVGDNSLKNVLIDKNNGMVETTLSQSLYKYQALCLSGGKYASWVFDDICTKWGYMLDKGATSFWETIKGADDFDGAGSLCHGWSAIPAYFYQAFLLGVTPLEPGFALFEVNPMQSGLSFSDCIIPTPHGNISISRNNEKSECFNLKVPENTSAIVFGEKYTAGNHIIKGDEK